MDYNKILKLSREKGFTKKALSDGIMMTPQGFRNMLDNQTMTVTTLEKISQFLGVSPCYWWKEEGSTFHVGEETSEYVTRPDNNYIHRDAFNRSIELMQSNFAKERELMTGQIAFLQNLVNQTLSSKAV